MQFYFYRTRSTKRNPAFTVRCRRERGRKRGQSDGGKRQPKLLPWGLCNVERSPATGLDCSLGRKAKGLSFLVMGIRRELCPAQAAAGDGAAGAREGGSRTKRVGRRWPRSIVADGKSRTAGSSRSRQRPGGRRGQQRRVEQAGGSDGLIKRRERRPRQAERTKTRRPTAGNVAAREMGQPVSCRECRCTHAEAEQDDIDTGKIRSR